MDVVFRCMGNHIRAPRCRRSFHSCWFLKQFQCWSDWPWPGLARSFNVVRQPLPFSTTPPQTPPPPPPRPPPPPSQPHPLAPRQAIDGVMSSALCPQLVSQFKILNDYTGILPFDVIIVTIYILCTGVLLDKTVCWLLGIFGGVKKAKFAVCFSGFSCIPRWLDWCQVGSLSGDSLGGRGDPSCGNCGVLGERVGAVVCWDQWPHRWVDIKC